MIVSETTTAASTATKRQLIKQAFSECAVNGWEYDIEPEEKSGALTRLDALMRELEAAGLSLSYTFPSGIGQGDLDDMLGCPDGAFHGLSVLLAQRLCPTMGKTMNAESRVALYEAKRAVRACAAYAPPSVTLGTNTPVGAGNRYSAVNYPFATE